LLLHRADNLEKDSAARLERSLKINEPLQCAYLLKEELGEIWTQSDGRKAWAFLREWSAKAKASSIRQLEAMARTLRRHAKGILSFYKTGITSGKMEGTNRKIRGLLASAYGFHDSDFLKSRLYALH
jgi:transposase